MQNHSQKNDVQLTFRPYTPQDVAGVIALWEQAYGKDMPVEVWRWKFHENPYGIYGMVCLVDQDFPVAMYAGIPLQGNWRGKEVPFVQHVDLMTHTDYRGRGMIVQTFQNFIDKYGGVRNGSFHYGFPGRRQFQLGKRYLGYQAVPEGQAYMTASPSQLGGLGKGWRGWRVHRLPTFQPVFDHLQKRINTYYPFAAIRDNRFVKWRFFDHPLNTYDVYIYRDLFFRVLGYAVVFLHQADEATLVDVFAVPEEKVLRALMARLGKDLNQRSISRIQTWLPSQHMLTHILQQCGFSNEEEPLGIVATWLKWDHVAEHEQAVHDLYFSMADADLF